MPTATANPADPSAKGQEHTSVKETLISITIAFALAFVFRAFVIEAYVIPTGSMAPTLMGQHMRFRSPESGYEWAVNPWFMRQPAEAQVAERYQGTPKSPIRVTDPMSGATIERSGVDRRSGDRILVLKFLRHVFEASRFDVVVFKAPHEPQTNYIKRLLGLPGEQVALIDGDVFTRTPQPGDPPAPNAGAWDLPGWAIARKSERVQREVWQPVFDSAYTPHKPVENQRVWFTSPWSGGDDPRWQIAGRRAYRYEGSGATTLAWNGDARPINERYAYNEHPQRDNPDRFPVSDVRLACAIEPDQSGLKVQAVVRARRHEFRGVISGNTATLEIREAPADGDAGPWAVVQTGALKSALPAGEVTNIEFWHADQSIQLWVGGERILSHDLEWSPAERILAATGLTIGQALAQERPGQNIFARTDLYQAPEPRWEFEGSAFTLRRIALDRDLHYRADRYPPRNPKGEAHARANQPAAATHPASTPTLSPDQFFTCGDNSPASLDARLWDTPDAFVASQIDPTQGVVPRDMMLGKAFFVYFPSATEFMGYRAIPDFGRFRWIW